MRITRLQLRNVRRHEELDLELAPGLTIVRGPNESGKSTLQRAIELALTRRVTSASSDLDGMRSWNAHEDDRPWVRMEFEEDDLDGEGVKKGVLEKSFRGPKGTVKLQFDRENVTDPARADELLAELTGIPSEAFFRSTASVRHHELDGLARDEAALRDRLQASISGADRGTSRARRKLERALFELNTKGDKNPGRIKVAEANLATASAALRNGEAALAQLEQDRDALAEAREERTATEAALTERRSMLDKARLAERLVSERDQARERFERYRTAVEVSRQIEELEASHPSSNGLPALRDALAKARAADLRIRELKATLAGEIEVDFTVEEPTPRAWRPTAIAAFVVILAAIAIGIAGQLDLLPRNLPALSLGGPGSGMTVTGAAILALLLALFGVGLALVGRRQRIRHLAARKTKDLREQEIERRLRGRSILEQELQMQEVTLQNLLAALDLPDLPAVEKLVEAEEAHSGQILRLRAQLEGLVGREPVETLPELRDKAALEIEQKGGALEELGPIAREPRARERLEVEVAEAERAVNAARDAEAQARARVEQNPVDAEEVAGHAERVAIWSEQLATLQRRTRVYDATLKALDAAERTTMRTATRYLERRMVDDLARVTAGRYKRVKVDDENLAIRVYAPERGDWVDVATLSQGTLDTIYLAARIGLVRLVTGDRRPPLVLDDPFVTLDDDRATRALELLRDVSSDFQVIYLTTSDRYDASADKVCVLEPPTGVTPDLPFDDAEPAGTEPAGTEPAGTEEDAAEADESARVEGNGSGATAPGNGNGHGAETLADLMPVAEADGATGSDAEAEGAASA
ncbi:MAG TPA: AAA family ATPase [Candidatus Binatia bacterium]|nr:AAA family ATPase [Candidatus Binatia bacterium]